MRSSSSSRAFLAAFLVAGILGACDGDRCVRTSDCDNGLECRAGTCSEPPASVDAAVDEPDAAGDEPDAAVDVPDAAAGEPDAASSADAGDDGGAFDGGADASLQQEDDGGQPDPDAGLDASL